MHPVTALAAGRRILDSVMNRAGFRYVSGPSGKGSGGEFASGSYVRGDRKLELHYRSSLGLVTYHFGARVLSHQVRPSEDPLQAFRDLADDLEHYGQEFLTGTDDSLAKRFADASSSPKPSGSKAKV